MSGENVPQSENYTAPLQTTHVLVNVVTVKKQYWFCGGNFHNHPKCTAWNSECNTCGKTGHWAKTSQSRHNQRVTVVINSNELCAVLAADPNCLASFIIPIEINNYSASILNDSVSSSSFINNELAQILQLKMKPFTCYITFILLFVYKAWCIPITKNWNLGKYTWRLLGLLYFWPKECLLPTTIVQWWQGLYSLWGKQGCLYQFTRIPFGVTNGIATFQPCIDNFVDEENHIDRSVYLNNIPVTRRD